MSHSSPNATRKENIKMNKLTPPVKGLSFNYMKAFSKRNTTERNGLVSTWETLDTDISNVKDDRSFFIFILNYKGIIQRYYLKWSLQNRKIMFHNSSWKSANNVRTGTCLFRGKVYCHLQSKCYLYIYISDEIDKDFSLKIMITSYVDLRSL